MSTRAQIFPGVYFDVVQAAVEDSLPRMDIASFVGYASAGPINTPVAVEDIRRFREIFGQDLELAWDSEKNERVKSVLGLSVEAFFRNGGRRCWIVRVADELLAQTATYILPRMLCCNGSVLQPAIAYARSPGSWAEKIKVNTVLQVVQLPLAKNAAVNAAYFHVGADGWSISLVASAAQLGIGDLISIRPYPNTRMYLVVGHIISTSFGVQVSGSQAFLLDENANASPRVFDSSLSLNASELFENDVSQLLQGKVLFSISSFDALGVSQSLFASTAVTSPPISSPATLEIEALYSAQLLRFDCIVQDNNKTEWRLSQLGFVKQHRRFWGLLPSDEKLFAQTDGRTSKNQTQSSQSFLDEINTPRFPLASGFSHAIEEHNSLYLPIGMPVFIDATMAVKGEFSIEASTLALNGIENAGSTLFIDKRLAGVGSDLLRREGNALAFLTENSEPLVGIHSLLSIPEATVVSVPDASHRRWDNIAPPYPLPLPAPAFIDVQVTEVEGEYAVQWTDVDSAVNYRLEWSEDADFLETFFKTISGDGMPRVGQPVDLIPIPDTACTVNMGKKGQRTLYFRIRAANREQVSAWSQNIAKQIPEADFLDCEFFNAEYLAVTIQLNGSTLASPSLEENGYVLDLEFDYATVDDAAIDSTDSIDIQKSSEFIFLNAETIFSSSPANLDVAGNLQLSVDSPLDASVYYRARAHSLSANGKLTLGPWSNTLTHVPSRLSQASLQQVSDFNDADILAVHRGLLRLCYARGDLFGVLSLPRHYTVQNAQDHFAKLSPMVSYDGPLISGSDVLTARVNPLNIGEANVCSHAGLYYPWFASRNESAGQGSIRFNTIPPDGAVSGKISAKSIERGAWIAPANSPIVDVLALDTNISSAQWAALMQSHINVIRDQPRGFLLLSADTLTDNFELKEVNVRRLMSMLMRLAQREGNRYVFEPNSAAFQERVQQHFESIFDTLFARGAFAGKKASQAYRVVTDSSVNTVQSIEAGRFIVELHVAPSHALKFIRVRLVQTGPSQLQVQEVAV
ncbi:MAG: hypothetical protein ACI9Y1_000102 [Lentisphaeria bacterium]|jgi:hypothetical protein